jgi:phosphoglycolate phosphatase-like HAD superfamily hydrolase
VAKKQIYLALDFDGVIADSIYECLVVAFNAFSNYRNGTKLIKTLDEINGQQLKQARYLRNFIRSGEDYVYIQQIISDKVRINNQLEFDKYCAIHQEKRNLYFQIFYNEREEFSLKYFKEWIALNPFYDGIKDFLQSYPDKGKLYIITTKKIEFAKKIISAHSIGLLHANFYHASQDRSKREIILQLLNSYQIDPSDFYFIDDQVDTLLKLNDLGINCYLAKWGYNNEDQQKRARDDNISIIQLDKFLNKFTI